MSQQWLREKILTSKANAEFEAQIATDGTQHLYVVYTQNQPGGKRSDIYLLRSDNLGKTWSQPINLSKLE